MFDYDYIPIRCVQCGRHIYGEDNVIVWVGAEPAVNWPGDPHCADCAPSVLEDDTLEEHNE